MYHRDSGYQMDGSFLPHHIYILCSIHTAHAFHTTHHYILHFVHCTIPHYYTATFTTLHTFHVFCCVHTPHSHTLAQQGPGRLNTTHASLLITLYHGCTAPVCLRCRAAHTTTATTVRYTRTLYLCYTSPALRYLTGLHLCRTVHAHSWLPHTCPARTTHVLTTHPGSCRLVSADLFSHTRSFLRRTILYQRVLDAVAAWMLARSHGYCNAMPRIAADARFCAYLDGLGCTRALPAGSPRSLRRRAGLYLILRKLTGPQMPGHFNHEWMANDAPVNKFDWSAFVSSGRPGAESPAGWDRLLISADQVAYMHIQSGGGVSAPDRPYPGPGSGWLIRISIRRLTRCSSDGSVRLRSCYQVWIGTALMWMKLSLFRCYRPLQRRGIQLLGTGLRHPRGAQTRICARTPARGLFGDDAAAGLSGGPAIDHLGALGEGGRGAALPKLT